MSNKSLLYYYNVAAEKVKAFKTIQTLSGARISPEAWNAFQEFLAIQEHGINCEKNSQCRLNEKVYKRFVNSVTSDGTSRFALVLVVTRKVAKARGGLL